MRWSRLGTGMDVRGRGDITFKEDLTDIAQLSPGGYLSVREWTLFIAHTIEIRNEGGALTHKYYVAGLSRPYDGEAKRWLAAALPVLVRRSGLGAEARTRQILAAGGPSGVLDEIRELDSDWVRRRYFSELFKAAPLDHTTLARALALAADSIQSDFELTETLRAAAPAAALDAELAQAYVTATNRIDSDFEQRRALEALLRTDGVVAAASELALQSAVNIDSDFEKAELIRTALRSRVDRAGALFIAVGRMDSDFEKRRALSPLVANRDISLEAKTGLLGAAAGIGSAFERAELLLAFAKAYGVDQTTAAPFFAAMRNMDSDFERRRVLAAVARKPPLPRDVVQGVLDTVSRFSSDFERAETLLAVLAVQPLEAELRSAFIAAAERMNSPHEQNRVLAALVKSERR